MAEEPEKGKEKGKKETVKRGLLKNPDKMRYAGIIFFAVLISIFSFYVTRKVVLPRVYKSKIEKQLESELGINSFESDTGDVYSKAVSTTETGEFIMDTTGVKTDSNDEEHESIFNKIFGKRRKKEDKKRKGLGEIIKVADITVNTNRSNGLRFVLVELALEVHDKKVSQEIKDKEPQIRDMFISYFRSKTAPEIARLDFQERSKKELMEKLNNLLTEGEVDSIYYTKLILQ